MNDLGSLIVAAIVLAVSISACYRSRHWAHRSENAAGEAKAAARRAKSAADRSELAAARSIKALRDKAAAIRSFAQTGGHSLDYQWAVMGVADDLDRAAERLDPSGPGVYPASGGVSAKDSNA
jgi:hypothetical protein